MHRTNRNLVIDRALALHKMARLATMASAQGGYLNFMGNEFGHPEWIDFPREGNNWSYQYARRLWGLCYQHDLCYAYLHAFDRDAVRLLRQHQLYRSPCGYDLRHDADKILSFARESLLFAFNFHWDKSFSDYWLPVAAGTYQVVLSSDNAAYGGFERVDTSVRHFSKAGERGAGLHLYLPSRCALVLQKQD